MQTFYVFRCGIPVNLMGETGCGKTRLIRFMCQLRAGKTGARNMLLVKVGKILLEEYKVKLQCKKHAACEGM